MSDAGQTCIGIERARVAAAVDEDSREPLLARVRPLRPGSDATASYAPLTRPEQAKVIARHIHDALARSARPLLGGP